MMSLIIFILTVVGMWKVFEKAGIDGWKALIPVYNIYLIVTEICGKPWWYLLLFFIPIVNIFVWVIICVGVANSFGRPLIFGLALAIFPMIVYLILGFNDDKYIQTIK